MDVARDDSTTPGAGRMVLGRLTRLRLQPRAQPAAARPWPRRGLRRRVGAAASPRHRPQALSSPGTYVRQWTDEQILDLIACFVADCASRAVRPSYADYERYQKTDEARPSGLDGPQPHASRWNTELAVDTDPRPASRHTRCLILELNSWRSHGNARLAATPTPTRRRWMA